MEQYNQMIASHLLDNIENGVIHGTPQPTMFGGKRMRTNVLPSSTEYDYPSSLAVGSLDGSIPDMLGGSFWSDVGKGFNSVVGPVAKAVTPIAQDVATQAIVNGLLGAGGSHLPISQSARRRMGRGGAMMGHDGHGIYHGGAWYDSIVKGAKSVGNQAIKDLTPVAQQFANQQLNKGVDYLKGQIGSGRRGRKRGGAWYDDIGKALVPVATKVASEALPVMLGLGHGRKKKGGALITNHPAEFHSTVYPPALASYARGSGRKQLPHSGKKRESARGAIVAEVMKKHGLNLAQASKYVKEHGLY